MILTFYQAEEIREHFVSSHEGTPAPTERTPIPMKEISAPTNPPQAKGEEERRGEEKKKVKQKSQDPAPIFKAVKGLEEGDEANKKNKKEEKKTKKKKDKTITRSYK